jgi:hypothetical protein
MFSRRCIAWSVLALLVISAQAPAQVATSGPILPSERQTTESSRSVAASDYRDAYCARWTDGCVECRRTSANEMPSCQPAARDIASCRRQPVKCRALLGTMNRVCLTYTDGCNECAGGRCTLVACSEKKYECTGLRRTRYDDPQLVALDLRGHWRLTDPQGRSCEIIIDHQVSPTAGCIPLGAPITRLKELQVAGSTIQLATSDNGAPLTFATADLDSLSGVEQSTGHFLVRLESEPLEIRYLEGTWLLSVTGGSTCDLFLSMRLHRIEATDSTDIPIPHEVSFMSRCMSPTDLDSMQVSVPSPESRNRQRAVLLPRWTTWQLDGHNIAFRDVRDGRTVFKFDNEKSWTAELAQTGHPPVVLRLERQFR